MIRAAIQFGGLCVGIKVWSLAKPIPQVTVKDDGFYLENQGLLPLWIREIECNDELVDLKMHPQVIGKQTIKLADPQEQVNVRLSYTAHDVFGDDNDCIQRHWNFRNGSLEKTNWVRIPKKTIV